MVIYKSLIEFIDDESDSTKTFANFENLFDANFFDSGGGGNNVGGNGKRTGESGKDPEFPFWKIIVVSRAISILEGSFDDYVKNKLKVVTSEVLEKVRIQARKNFAFVDPVLVGELRIYKRQLEAKEEDKTITKKEKKDLKEIRNFEAKKSSNSKKGSKRKS